MYNGMQKMARINCKFLEKLSLESCTLNTECCKEISNCIDISVLNLSMCGGLNLTGILSVLKLRSLTELNVAWCSFNKQQVDVICKMLPSTMTRLNISGCEENMSDLNLSDLILSCPNIKELDLSDNTSLTEDIFSELTNLHNLEHLSLSRCFNIKSLSKLDLNLVPYFEYLDIFDLELTSVPDKLKINQFLFTSIARPTLKDHKTIWGLYVKS
ncbi:PREDICTED: S-phase kinase-associated protein 2-like [Polistes dominula]|uniref:S-phase kinase-associated protein 2-like n=1 Tax=Polistes dominula TaxID=743375 RepID=A0ABM1J227_POLDO|nr:PREDICTED: S-phase kinase-associated protein 2-like [Polistes dominula]